MSWLARAALVAALVAAIVAVDSLALDAAALLTP